MKMIGTVLMTLTRIGVFLIASPLMLIQLIMGLGVATLGATMANMLVQLWLTNLLGDVGIVSGVIRIGVFVLLYLVAWVTVTVLWAQMHRLDTLFRKDRGDTFVANAGVLQCFGVNDFETAKWLSQSMGKETIGYQTESHRPGDIATTTQHITARDLMTPDEIMQIDPSVQLLRVQGKPVIIARKLRYFADKEFDGLYLSPDAQPTNPKSEPTTLNA